MDHKQVSWLRLNFLLGLVLCLLIAPALAQKKKANQGKPEGSKEERKTEAQDTIKIDVQLVNVPVVASDRNDVYVADLRQEEFTLTEDGVPQEIVFFSTVKEAFHVVLMLDTSGSTRAKLTQIQEAAQQFVEQLQPADRIKVITFDDGVNDLSAFTNDRASLRAAIAKARPGQGTKLYDAMKYALNSLRVVTGRKAIVLFSDGVDSYSDTTTYDDNIEQLEEAGVIIYPIRYETRRDTEAMLRQQREEQVYGGIGGSPLPGTRQSPIGTTPPTTPGGDNPVPNTRPNGRDPYGLPVPPVMLPVPRPRYPNDPNRGPLPPGTGGGGYPDERYPQGRYPDSRYPDSRYPDDRLPDASRNPRLPGGDTSSRYPRRDDSIAVMLDGLYRTASLYLNGLASASGGKLHYAEDLRLLPDVFAKIAAALRNQYSLGYYPTNGARDGKYHKIQVKTTRRNVALRARPGYRAPKG